MNTAEIRRRFLDYFAQRGHEVVPSAPLLYNDPTLLFVNAGMVPFKPYFTGAEAPPFNRATSVQKCVRTLDIEEVGKTTRHGTFFQMNGNFSFGDYFKEQAISYAWELVTGSTESGCLGFDPDTVWVTVLHSDDEAARLWAEVAGLPQERIQRRGLRDNYWHMGIPGPGGPCSEIYIDRGPEYGPDGGPVVDEDRFLEIWNLVFMQEELSEVRAKDDFDTVGDLPRKNIDTGMGLERVAYLLQGVDNLYEIDEVFPVIARAAELAGTGYGAKRADDVRLRVVGDHIRSALMLIGDGVTPGNEARGYVLRRLLRRTVRSMRLLGVREPVLNELLPLSSAAMKASYPEVEKDFDRISQIAYAEEDAFRRTLTAGTQIFDLAVRDAKSHQLSTLTGERAFQLHDTYGFPIDLTLEMASEQGLAVDEGGFRRLMQEQKDRAKADAKSKKAGSQGSEAYRQLRDRGTTPFTGYSELVTDSKVRGIVVDGQLAQTAGEGSTVEVVLEQTPFYAESGGQDSDAGVITADGVRLEVVDVQRPVKGLIVHRVRVLEGELRTGQDVLASVDAEWRLGACQAHSGTHVMHAALRQVLGPTALQSGSYNKPGYLRLDFAWPSGLSQDLRAAVEEAANQGIRKDLNVSATYMPLARAREIGALALFGETYDEEVRVVEMGGLWSRELCGGTHVQHSSQIGLVSLLGESSVGSGVRRVEAFVGIEAFRFLARERSLVLGLTDALKVQPDQLMDRVTKMVAQLKNAEREIAALRSKSVLAEVDSIVAKTHDMWGVGYIGHHAEGVGGGDLRTLALEIRSRVAQQPSVICVIGGTQEKPSVVVATTEGARYRGLNAGELVRIASETLGGRGGGNDDLAQGGGNDAGQIPAALKAVEYAIGHRVQS
ncbi:alanine--tRNA ligase [Microlunatus panaciterrae]|uniref:Alanine--tRNA ligase n=1 Tax=Microlunatus panaciterrae TaxID=400768 RepID=A0ABS2RE36_9ACTN|nr:alanine--tRNA ligase [Microlunatus panaciterrae]MBM7797270.1 alanyl-tRNA synthetase [Microlunatus panaciterrae]